MNRINLEALRTAHDNGMTSREQLAEHFGVTPGSITRALRRLDLPLRPRGVVDRQELARLVADGWTLPQLAEHYEVHVRTIGRIKTALGIAAQPPSHPMTPERLAKIRDMLDDGAPHAEIARTLHVDPHTIRKYFPGTAWTKQQHAEHVSALRRLNPHFNRRPAHYDTSKYPSAA